MKANSNIAVVSFETSYAPFGGLATVLRWMVAYLGYHLTPVIHVFTPYHWRIPKTTQVPTTQIGRVVVPFDATYVTVHIKRFDENLVVEGKPVTIRWHFLHADDQQFFAGEKQPYKLGDTEEEANRNLRRDSHFFGAAVARAAQEVFPNGRVKFFMQDWSALTTALALPPSSRWDFHGALHNFYDSAVTASDLRRFGIPSERIFGQTVLTSTLPLLKSQPITVSQQFALDARHDMFISRVFTPHLQKQFADKGIFGINHGPFVVPKFPHELVASILRGNVKGATAWKAKMKAEALRLIPNLVDSVETPVWGSPAKFIADPETSWFIMGGRHDGRQKGFCVAAKAIASVIEDGETRGKWLLLPMEGIEGQAGLMFLKKLAERFPDRVLVLPFIWKEGFAAISASAAFGLVPSYFEPGGLASEFVANLTPVICSAVGGSLSQVVPWLGSATFHQGVAAKCHRWHSMSAPPSGIVYGPRAETYEGWKAINEGGYSLSDEPDVVQHRERIPLFMDLADELALAMKEGIRLYHDNPGFYFEMAANGVVHFQRNFSWMKAGAEYARQLAD